MLLNRSSRRHFVLAVIVALSVSSPTLAIQKKEKDKPAPRGTPVLWREPADIASRDLFLGPGGASMRPDLRRITFVKEEKGGYSTKYRVKDGAGRVWVAKIGKEAQSETAAVRLLWAVGYHTEVNYLVPRLVIEGKGTFENVRLEARPESVDRLDEWKWSDNPFVGTKELQGLIVLMALLRQIKGSRNEPGDYASDKFVEGVEGGRVRLNFSGKNSGLMRDITIEDARWLGGILSRLSDKQLEDAFRAANYSPEDVRVLAASVCGRINQLTGLAGGAAAPE